MAGVSSMHMTRIMRSFLGRRRERFHRLPFCSFQGRSLLQLQESSHRSATTTVGVSHCFSTATTPDSDDHKESLEKRIPGIHMNPKSIGKHILPGDFVIKKNPKTGKERKIFTDRAFGYFWMMKDLQETDSKPILSNETLIPPEQAQVFPSLTDLVTLTDETVDMPQFFLRNNRTKDDTAQCTLVAISFRDFGFKLLPSWTIPFEEALCKDSEKRFEVVRISIVEGWFLKTFLTKLLTNQAKNNTPVEQHGTFLLKFGNVGDFMDALRMHNTMTAYVYLLDGLGRVRFAGSGKATPEEAERLVDMARELTPTPAVVEQKKKKSTKKIQQRGRNFRQ